MTAVLADDLAAVDAPLVYSQAIALGYWSTDLLTAMLDATGAELTTASFHRTATVEGVRHDPGPEGAPCPVDTLTMQRDPAGGAAMVQVVGGIYRPVVAFDCW